MPSAPPPLKVLVTGANGYIAIWVVRSLLDEGYSVRGTVRSEAKVSEVTVYFPKEVANGSLDVVVVGDLTQPGAFDKAVQGVDAICHVASPCHWPEGDPDEIIIPALKGTIGVLESARDYGTSIKRVVITASVSTISRVCLDEGDTHWGNPQLKTFSEKDWNEESIALCQKLGRNAPKIDKYQASKVTAEKAARKFVETNQDKIPWDLVTVHPSFVFGPPIQDWTDPKLMSATIGMWHSVIFSEERSPFLKNSSGGWVDVRDVALGHVRALQRPEAGGQRFLLTSGHFIWNDFNDIANKLKPTLPKLKTPIAPPRPDIVPEYLHRYNLERVKNTLGINFRSQEETTRDTLEAWFEKGM